MKVIYFKKWSENKQKLVLHHCEKLREQATRWQGGGVTTAGDKSFKLGAGIDWTNNLSRSKCKEKNKRGSSSYLNKMLDKLYC